MTTDPAPTPAPPTAERPAAAISATEEELALVFTTWAQRYEDDPSGFEDSIGEARSYGVASARYFVDLFEELLVGNNDGAVASRP